MMVESKNIPKGDDNVDIGCGNEFGGGGEEDAVDPNIEMVNNIVDSFKYTQTTLDGAGFKSWLKDYMGAILEKMKAADKPVEDRKAFKARAAIIAKFFLSQFKEVDFYLGESFNADSMVFSMYPEGALYPNFYYIMDGLKEYKY